MTRGQVDLNPSLDDQRFVSVRVDLSRRSDVEGNVVVQGERAKSLALKCIRYEEEFNHSRCRSITELYGVFCFSRRSKFFLVV